MSLYATAATAAQMLWLLLWLAAVSRVHARPPSGKADSSVYDSARAGNYTFHISVDRLEVQNVNFNVHLAVFPGGSAPHPAFQPPREQHHRPGRPPLTTATLGPEDYGRLLSPFLLAYPLPSWVFGGSKGDAAATAAAAAAAVPSGGSLQPTPPFLQHFAGAPRPEDHIPSPPQQSPQHSVLLEKITTTPTPHHSTIDTHAEEPTTIPPQYPVPHTSSEKLITTSPPQYPKLETHSATFETLQTL